MSTVDDPLIEAALERLLPGGGAFPSAKEVNLAAWIGGQPRFAAAMDWLRENLPGDFAQLSSETQRARLEELEALHSEHFGAVVVAAYSGYYIHPDVLAAIEAERGYKARPPQPGGYDLAAFDSAILAVPSSRPPSYRDPNKGADT